MQKHKLLYIIPILIVSLGTLITVLLINEHNETNRREQELKVDNIRDIYKLALEQEIHNSIENQQLVANLFSFQENITYDQFFTVTKDLFSDNGLQAYGWDPQITKNQRSDFEKQARELYNNPNLTITGLIDGQVVQSPEKDYYYPVYYLYPLEGNERAILFDLSSNPNRNESIQKGLLMGKSSATSPIRLVQETETQSSFLIFSPVHHNSEIIGFISTVYRIGDLFEHTLNRLDKSYNLRIKVNDIQSNVDIVYLEIKQRVINIIHDVNNDFVSDYQVNTQLVVLDRIWNITIGYQWTISDSQVLLLSILIPVISVVLAVISIIIIIIARQYYLYTIEDGQKKARDTFISYIFHEVRVPLNTVVIGIQNIIKTCTVKEQLNTLHIVEDSLNQTIHILNDILDLRKIEQGKFTLTKHVFPIKNLTETVTTSFRDVARDKSIEFAIDIDPQLHDKSIYADKLRILQCINNYLSNAFKYTKEGTVTLTITQIKASEIKFTIKDTGCGISKSNLSRLFVSYSQINSSNQSEIGTGLGLVITKQIAILHEGEVAVISEPDQGSEFSFTIKSPITVTKPDDSEEESIEEIRETYSQLQFLIVDDSKPNCLVLSEFLKIKGIRSDMVHNGRDAIEQIKSNKEYDLIIMDKHMPIMDGLEATATIRKLGYQTPIVALTGLSDKEQLEQFMEAGANEILIKPFDFTLFDGLIKHLVIEKRTK